MKNRTSVTDRLTYIDVCREAAKYNTKFAKFKRNPNYIVVLEHCTKKHGELYKNWILKTNTLDLTKFNKFRENDKYGKPTTYNYGKEFGRISPSTLRYVKVLSDLVLHFGDLSNFNIIEIGVGYGGQAKIIMDYFNIKQYNFIDLPAPMTLTKKYLGKFNYDNCKFLDYNKLPNQKYDLIISNYAITECTQEVQDLYMEKIINNSTHCYITGNVINSTFGISEYDKMDWKAKYPNATFSPDNPCAPNTTNYIMTF